MDDLKQFEKIIKYTFKNKKLLQKIFVHRSYINENKGKVEEHNERIEFLGDAVLELSATKYLYDKFPQKAEGELTAIRSALVNTESLFKIAASLNMNDFLLMAKGEKSSKKGREHILANTFEALVGAIYLDSDFNRVDQFLKDYLFDYVDEIIKKSLHKDPKSYFQELAQEIEKITPSYKEIRSKGPDHDKQFEMGLFLGEELVAIGVGSSKQKAEIEAARNGLVKKKWN